MAIFFRFFDILPFCTKIKDLIHYGQHDEGVLRMGNKKFQKVIVIIMAVLMLLSAISMGLTMIL